MNLYNIFKWIKSSQEINQKELGLV